MMIKAFNITLGVVVALTVWCYAVMFTYIVVRAALLFYHLMPS